MMIQVNPITSLREVQQFDHYYAQVNVYIRGLSKKFVDKSNFFVNNNVNRRKV
jgi:hypothetical protein